MQSAGFVVRDDSGQPRVIAGVDTDGVAGVSLVTAGRTVYVRNSTQAPEDFDVVGVVLDLRARMAKLEARLPDVSP